MELSPKIPFEGPYMKRESPGHEPRAYAGNAPIKLIITSRYASSYQTSRSVAWEGVSDCSCEVSEMV